MEKKLKVADFAALLGIVPKTVYKMIERNEVITVSERVNNRQTTLIVTNEEQIENFRKIYGKIQVNNGNCYNSVTENEQSQSVIEGEIVENNTHNNDFANEVIDRIIALNDGYNAQLNEYNNRIQQVNEELITAKSKMLLLEDKAGREGLYLNEINELKEGNKRLKLGLYALITVSVMLLLGLTGYVTYNLTTQKLSSSYQVNSKSEQVSYQVEAKKNEVKPIKGSTSKKR